jgi:CelD/BcsL family acetyltransferase involved in cellulose biosynthesis
MIPLEFEKQLQRLAGFSEPHMRLLDVRNLTNSQSAQWARLSHWAGADSIFACDWFVRPVLEQFDHAHAYRLCVAIDERGEWFGAMPIARANRFGRIPLRNWTNLKNANQFLGTPLIAPGHEAQFWSMALRMFDDAPGNAFAFYASEFPDDHRVTKALRQCCINTGRSHAIVSEYERAMLTSGKSYEEYWAADVPKKRQKRLACLERQLAKDHGTIGYITVTDSSELDRWIDDFLAIEMGSWKGRNGSALASASDSAMLFRSVVTSAFASGKIACLSLCVAGRPIAMSSYFIDGGHAFGFKNCFDSHFARYAPGLLLIRQITTLLDGGEQLYFDSCASAGEVTISGIWKDRRRIVNICVGLNGRRARGKFSAILLLRRLWHKWKLHRA